MHHVCDGFPPKTLVALFWKSNPVIFLKSFLTIGQYQNKSENNEFFEGNSDSSQYRAFYPKFSPNNQLTLFQEPSQQVFSEILCYGRVIWESRVENINILNSCYHPKMGILTQFWPKKLICFVLKTSFKDFSKILSADISRQYV